MNGVYSLAIFLLGFRGIEVKGIKVADLFILALFGCLMGKWILGSKRIWISHRFLTRFFLLYVALLLSLFKVSDFTYSILDPFRYALVGIFFISIVNFQKDSNNLRYTLKIVLTSGFISAIASIVIFSLWLEGLDVSFFLHKLPSGVAEGRTQPFFYDPNHYASFLLIPALFSLYYFLLAYEKRDTWELVALSFYLLVIGSAIITTGSRGGIISLFLGLGSASILYFYRKLSKGEASTTIAAFVIILGILLMLYFEWGLYSQYEFRHGTQEKEVFLRIQLWEGALYAFKDNPFIGVGTSDFINDYPKIATKYGLYVGAQNFPHNSYLGLLAEMGILGFIAGMSLLFYIYRNAVYNLRFGFDRNLAIVLFSILVAQSAEMFVYSMFHARRLWFIFALIVSYAKIMKTSEASEV